ncbi:hypothetical protein DI392_18020 [Vibrio albus]|jgi:uncharacterized integral membrane protein|uniref:Integral membrane protein n=1 Tax=Vibrio albus TaxID=2200953 RepID=A0A2U3B554_9VIBR|nr:DUF2301 domain-containing membrane protein [Vibrio albus]PWI31928.1 hypothetical protein DI392_18020 [Vibrio albus]
MADPHIKPEMDRLDYLSVILYRSGFVLAFASVLLLPWRLDFPITEVTFLAAMLCASSLHIYMKTFRILLQMATWVGMICFIMGFPMFGLGGAFMTLGGLCYKEYFCFKVPGLQLQPLILAGLWLALFFEYSLLAKGLALVAGILLLIVSVAKWRMPLHFDIGDKSKYQI